MTASQEMICFLLFNKLCDYTVRNFVVGSSNRDDGTRKTRVKVENYLKVVSAQLDPVSLSSSDFLCNTWRSSAWAVHLSLLLICVFRQCLATNVPCIWLVHGYFTVPGIIFQCFQMFYGKWQQRGNSKGKRVYFNWKYLWIIWLISDP